MSSIVPIGGIPATAMMHKNPAEHDKDVEKSCQLNLLMIPGEAPAEPQKRMFFEIWEELKTLHEQDKLSEKAEQYSFFLQQIDKTCVEYPSQIAKTVVPTYNAVFYQTHHGIWYPRVLRYRNAAMRTALFNENMDSNYLKSVNLGIRKIGIEVRSMLNRSSLPLCLIAVQKFANKQQEHAVTLVLKKTDSEIIAWQKECLPLETEEYKKRNEEKQARGELANDDGINEFAKFRIRCQELLRRELKVRFVDVVGQLDIEEENVYDSMTECFRVVAEVLEGKSFLERDNSNFTRRYDVKSCKAIKSYQ